MKNKKRILISASGCPRVNKAAEYLDEMLPGWQDRVDWSGLLRAETVEQIRAALGPCSALVPEEAVEVEAQKNYRAYLDISEREEGRIRVRGVAVAWAAEAGRRYDGTDDTMAEIRSYRRFL